MNATTVTSRPKSFRLIAWLALLWNLLGLVMFYLQVSLSPEAVAAMAPEQRQVHEATPYWLNVAFGVAVIVGVLGAVGLLVKRRWAVSMFLISLLALLVQLVAAYAVTPAWQAYGPTGLIMPIVLVVIAVFLWGYARKAAARAWIS